MTAMREWIEGEVNEGESVQVACCWANVGLVGAYLTTSGQVCREEFSFVDDVDDPDEYATYDLPRMTWTSVKRLQRALISYQQ